jgi:hypothetical protein
MTSPSHNGPPTANDPWSDASGNAEGRNPPATATTTPGVTVDAARTRAMPDDGFLAAAIAETMAALYARPAFAVRDLPTFLNDVYPSNQRQHDRYGSRAVTHPDADVDTAVADAGDLLQRFYDASRYGTETEARQTAAELARAIDAAGYSLYVRADTIQVGRYVQAIGLDSETRYRDRVSGIVDAIYPSVNYRNRPDGLLVFEMTTPPLSRGGVDRYYEILVEPRDRLLTLPAPAYGDPQNRLAGTAPLSTPTWTAETTEADLPASTPASSTAADSSETHRAENAPHHTVSQAFQPLTQVTPPVAGSSSAVTSATSAAQQGRSRHR